MYHISLPAYITELIERLEAHGHEAYIVGGCVRNSYLCVPVSDYDMTTSASPEQMKMVFSDKQVIETGIQHGTLTVLSENHPVEITTYRIDGDYHNHRKPDSVQFTSSLREDLARRDFTVNAMAYHPKTGLVDLHHGLEDLNARIIRCVGVPRVRFEEDALRILRGIRFAATYGFSIDAETEKAIHASKYALADISAERNQSELSKILTAPYLKQCLINFPDVLSVIIPELASYGEQWSRIADAISHSEPQLSVRLAILLSAFDPPCAVNILKKLRFDRLTIDTVSNMLVDRAIPLASSKRELKHTLSQIGVDRLEKQLLFRVAMDPRLNTNPITSMLEEIVRKNEVYHRSMLAINGDNLRKLGIYGKDIGTVLQKLLEDVIDKDIKNERDALLAHCKTIFK